MLSERVRSRHDAAVATFSHNAREVNAVCDARAMQLWAELERNLEAGRHRRTSQIDDCRGRIYRHRASVKAESERFASGSWGLLQDELHSQGEQSLESRSVAVGSRRQSVVDLFSSTRANYEVQLATIESARTDLFSIESSRKESIRQLLDELASALAAASCVDETELLVIVQRATHAMNRLMVVNNDNATRLLAEAGQREVLLFREDLARLSDVYHDNIDTMRDSLILWSLQHLEGPLYRRPGHREKLLNALATKCKAVKGEVHQALDGLKALSQTLIVPRDPQSKTGVCGGTLPSGWLRAYDGDIHRPVFSSSLSVISEEWGAFLEVILRNGRCAFTEALDGFERAERELCEKANHVAETTQRQLHDLFTMTPAEREAVRSCILSEEFRFPLNTVGSQVEIVDEVLHECEALLRPLIDETAREGTFFIDAVRKVLAARQEELDRRLSSQEGEHRSVLLTVIHTSTYLDATASGFLGPLRDFLRTQEEHTLDYIDDKNRLEAQFAGLERAIEKASNTKEAKASYGLAVACLEELEGLYHRYHTDCIGPMEGAEEEMLAAFENQKMRLFDIIGVATESAGCRTVTAADGSQYHVRRGPWSFDGPPQAAAEQEKEQPQPSAAPPVVLTPTPAPPSSKKKGPTKKGEKEAVLDVPLPAPTAEPKALTDPLATLFEMRVGASISPSALLDVDQIAVFQDTLRNSLLSWLLLLGSSNTALLKAFNKERRTALNAEINELIRRHQRRAPSLQANVYERRVRMLQQALQQRQRQLEGLHARVSAMVNAVQLSTEDSAQILTEDLDMLGAIGAEVDAVVTGQALETHCRLYADHLMKVRAASRSRNESIRGQITAAVKSVLLDCDAFERNALRTFSQGGTVTEKERLDGMAKLAAFREHLAEAEESQGEAVDSATDQEDERIGDAEAQHDDGVARCRLELAFFKTLNSTLSSLKGKFSNLILASENTGGALEVLIAALESTLATTASDVRSLSFTDCQRRGDVGTSDLCLPEDWSGVDELLSTRLRSADTKVIHELQQSQTQKLLECLLGLRGPLFARGAVLDCLRHRVDFVSLRPELLVEPSAEIAEALVVPPPAPPPPPPKKGAKTKEPPSPSKAAPPPPAAPTPKLPVFVSADGFIDAPREILDIPTSLASTAAGLSSDAAAAAGAAIRAFILQHGAVVRNSEMGHTEEEVRAHVLGRIDEQRARMAEHLDGAQRRFREQVQRVFAAVSCIGDRLFRSLLTTSFSATAQRIGALLSVFEAFVGLSRDAREANNARLKGSLTAPSNRNALRALSQREESRQSATQKTIKTVWGASLREVQTEGAAASLRGLMSLQSFYWLLQGVVLPHHLTLGEAAVVGHHKSLRQLLKKGERNGIFEPEVPVLPTCTVELPPAKSGKAPANRDRRKTAQSAQASEHEAALSAALTPLEQTYRMFGGVNAAPLDVFDRFLLQSPETAATLVDHHRVPSQWVVGAYEVVPQEPAPAAVPSPSKKDAAKKKSPSPAVEVPVVEVRDKTKPTAGHRAPSDTLHNGAFLSREQAVATIASVYGQLAGEATKHFALALLDERKWQIAWQEAMNKL